MVPKFSPEIHLGHILQAGVILVTIGGGSLGAFFTIKTSIDDSRTEYRASFASQDGRITALEKQQSDMRSDDKAFQGEMRQSLSKIIDSLADMKVQIAAKPDGRK